MIQLTEETFLANLIWLIYQKIYIVWCQDHIELVNINTIWPTIRLIYKNFFFHRSKLSKNAIPHLNGPWPLESSGGRSTATSSRAKEPLNLNLDDSTKELQTVPAPSLPDQDSNDYMEISDFGKFSGQKLNFCKSNLACIAGAYNM